jgi:hypothetical protein
MTTKGSDNPFPSIMLQEVADDGSDTPTPPADFQRLFVGEDGALRLIDAADVVTAVAGAFTGDAGDIPFTPAAGIAATDVQAAIVEDAGDLAAHLADTGDAHDASAVSVLDTAGLFTGTDAEAVLAELGLHHVASGARYPIQQFGVASASGTTRAPTHTAFTNGNRCVLITLTESTDSVSSVVTTNVTWSKIYGSTAGVAPVLEVWVGVAAASAGTTTTITWSGTAFHSCIGTEWAGLAGTLDASAERHVTTDATGAHPLATITPTVANALVICAVSTTSNATTFSTIEGFGLVRTVTALTLGCYWAFPGRKTVYGVASGGSSATCTAVSVAII